MFWGDAGGNLFILTFWKCLNGGPFGGLSSYRRVTLNQFVSDIKRGRKNRYHVCLINCPVSEGHQSSFSAAEVEEAAPRVGAFREVFV